MYNFTCLFFKKTPNLLMALLQLDLESYSKFKCIAWLLSKWALYTPFVAQNGMLLEDFRTITIHKISKFKAVREGILREMLKTFERYSLILDML